MRQSVFMAIWIPVLAVLCAVMITVTVLMNMYVKVMDFQFGEDDRYQGGRHGGLGYRLLYQRIRYPRKTFASRGGAYRRNSGRRLRPFEK